MVFQGNTDSPGPQDTIGYTIVISLCRHDQNLDFCIQGTAMIQFSTQSWNPWNSFSSFLIVCLLAVIVSGCQKDNVMETPEQVVLNFIADFHAWNVRAWENSRKARRAGESYLEASALAKVEYQKLVEKFYAKKVIPQSIAFGNISSHQLANEVIQSENITGHTAVVLTKCTDEHGHVHNYEYQLIQEAGQWRIMSLLNVTKDGRYECL